MVLDPSMALKSRGFSQGGRIQRGAGAGAGEDDGSLWTETPAEREQRIREEEMGIRGRKVLGEEKKVKPEDLERQRKEREAEEETRRKIREHVSRTGARVLLRHAHLLSPPGPIAHSLAARHAPQEASQRAQERRLGPR